MKLDLAVRHFRMDECFKKHLEEKINSLLDVSPSGAEASSKFTKTNVGYRGVLQIISSQGKFLAESAANDLEELTQSLFKAIYQQLTSWRDGRFVTENVKLV